MSAALSFILQVAAATTAPPADWSALPVFPLPRVGQVGDGTPFVRAEIAAGRCPVPADASRVVAPMAIHVGASGRVTRIVPRAIGCPTVEQFTVGLLISLTRSGAGAAAPPPPGWYQLAVSYAW